MTTIIFATAAVLFALSLGSAISAAYHYGRMTAFQEAKDLITAYQVSQ